MTHIAAVHRDPRATPPPAAPALEIAETHDTRERQAALELVGRVFCEERLGRPWSEAGAHFLADPDFDSARIFVARVGGRVVGTAWLHDGERLPIEAHLDLSEPRRQGLRLAQGSHMACAPEWRGHGISSRLFNHLARAAASSVDGLVFVAAVCHRAPEAVAGMVERLSDRYERRWRARARPGAPTLADDVAATPTDVPWLIESYARLGGVPMGPPLYFDALAHWALPMWAPLLAVGRRVARPDAVCDRRAGGKIRC